MEINRYEAIEIIKRQIEYQGCRCDIEWLRFDQPHIHDWIEFFEITEQELKE